MGRPLVKSRLLTRLLGKIPRSSKPPGFKRLPGLGDYGFAAPSPTGGSYLGSGPLTRDHKLRFWHSDLAGEPARLAEWESRVGVPDTRRAVPVGRATAQDRAQQLGPRRCPQRPKGRGRGVAVILPTPRRCA